MQSTINKTKKYIEQYITSVPWLRTLIIPALIALVIYNFFEIRIYQSMAEVTNKSNENYAKVKSALMFCVYFIVGYTIKLGYEFFNAYFVSCSIRNALTNFFGEYLKINYQSFTKVGIGEAQYNINRRVFALIEFLSSICVDFASNLLFFLIAIGSLGNEIKSARLKAVSLICILLFMLFSVIVQFLRSIARSRVNLGYEMCSRKMYDILYNYERIVSYDNLDYELGLFKKSMDYQVFYGTIFWVSNDFVSFINSLFFLSINTYLLGTLGVSTKENIDLKGYTLVFSKVKDKVLDMIDSFDSLANNFVNLDQSNIENCKMDENENGAKIQINNGDIEIKNLRFGYESKMIINNLSINIAQGEKLAITGINGSGKSTFTKILLGLYNYEGIIKIDGFEYETLSKKSIRESIAYVSQISYLFDTTIDENLKYGNQIITNEKLIEYAKLFNMHEMFKDLGYERKVGERGKLLSGGQRQKICFLRAIIKNAHILVLDEATSNMDEHSELEIIESIKKYMHNKTVIMIVHNLNLLKHFDQILFFEGGTKYQKGSLNELLENNESIFKTFYNSTILKAKENQ